MLFTLFQGATQAQQVQTVDAAWIQSIQQSKSDTLYIINFWATWCKPCIGELPVFDSITKMYSGEKLKVIMVSNDMKKDADAKLAGFISSNKMQSQVVWMSDLNANNWINKVDESWSGSIPATWVFKNSVAFRYFKEGEITFQELKLIIDQTIDLK